jgi:hypothetical protein
VRLVVLLHLLLVVTWRVRGSKAANLLHHCRSCRRGQVSNDGVDLELDVVVEQLHLGVALEVLAVDHLSKRAHEGLVAGEAWWVPKSTSLISDGDVDFACHGEIVLEPGAEELEVELALVQLVLTVLVDRVGRVHELVHVLHEVPKFALVNIDIGMNCVVKNPRRRT